MKFLAEQLRDQITRDVVGGWAKAASSDDKVGARQRFADGLFDIVASIRHGNLAGDDITKISKTATEPLLVRVEHTTQHELATGVDEFDVHARSLSRVCEGASLVFRRKSVSKTS